MRRVSDSQHRLRTIALEDEVRGLPWVYSQSGLHSEFLAR